MGRPPPRRSGLSRAKKSALAKATASQHRPGIEATAAEPTTPPASPYPESTTLPTSSPLSFLDSLDDTFEPNSPTPVTPLPQSDLTADCSSDKQSVSSALRKAQTDLKAALSDVSRYRKLYYNANRTISRAGKRTLEVVSSVVTRTKKRKVRALVMVSSGLSADDLYAGLFPCQSVSRGAYRIFSYSTSPGNLNFNCRAHQTAESLRPNLCTQYWTNPWPSMLLPKHNVRLLCADL